MKTEKNKHKVAVLTRNFDSSKGGAERYCVELTKRLSNLYDVHVFCQSKGKDIDIGKINFHHVLSFPGSRFINQLFFYFHTRKLTKGAFDLIHSHEILPNANILTIHVQCFRTHVTKSKGIKKIFNYISLILSPRKLAYFLLEKKTFSGKNKRFICVSDYIKQNLLENYRLNENLIDIAMPGININSHAQSAFKPSNKFKLPDNSFRILFVGNGFERKGLPTLLKAFNEIKSNDIYLLVAGKGNKNEALKNNISDKKIIFLGQVQHMHNLYELCDILVHPTLEDTFAMSVLEAMINKIPVIVSSKKYCGIVEYLDNNEVLILDNPEDFRELEQKLNLLINNADLWKKLSINGFNKAKEFTWEKTFLQTLNSYSKLL